MNTKYSEKTKLDIINEFIGTNITKSEIAKKYNIPYGTIKNWLVGIKKENKEERIMSEKQEEKETEKIDELEKIAKENDYNPEEEKDFEEFFDDEIRTFKDYFIDVKIIENVLDKFIKDIKRKRDFEIEANDLREKYKITKENIDSFNRNIEMLEKIKEDLDAYNIYKKAFTNTINYLEEKKKLDKKYDFPNFDNDELIKEAQDSLKILEAVNDELLDNGFDIEYILEE